MDIILSLEERCREETSSGLEDPVDLSEGLFELCPAVEGSSRMDSIQRLGSYWKTTNVAPVQAIRVGPSLY